MFEARDCRLAEDSRKFSEKIAADGNGPLNFPLLSDPQHRIIDAWGLKDPQYIKLKRECIPYPTVYVIDRSGRVVWSRTEKNFGERPTNAEIRSGISALR